MILGYNIGIYMGLPREFQIGTGINYASPNDQGGDDASKSNVQVIDDHIVSPLDSGQVVFDGHVATTDKDIPPPPQKE